jgi:HK97 family phage prohead protease
MNGFWNSNPSRAPAKAGAQSGTRVANGPGSPPARGRGKSEHSLRIAGYAALFGIADGAADIIRPGAFARTLKERSEPFPLYWQHRPAQRIGTVESLAEDERGLRVIARIERTDSLAAALLRRREVSGLSFGYRARGYRSTAGGRVLEDVDLFEVSLVTHPLQFGARVHLVR